MPDVPAYVQTEDKAFIRDTRTRALLNTDLAALERHRAKRRHNQEFQNKIYTLETEVADLKALVHELMKR